MHARVCATRPVQSNLPLKNLRDRFFDLSVNVPMQKIVTDRLRPVGQNDLYGVEQAKAQLRTALGMIDEEMRTKTWAMGDLFTMADCAAAPALFYADAVMPFEGAFAHAERYLQRLKKRASFARVLDEASPYRDSFPT